MITFFTVPKAFTGHIGLIQTNAIKSWLALVPRPEIILLGNDPGVAEFCDEHGLIHLPNIKTVENIPVLDGIFEAALKKASYEHVCYINSDIILFQDFLSAFQTVSKKFQKYLMISSRYNMDIESSLEFSNADIVKKLRSSAIAKDDMYPAGGTDFFAFPKGLYHKIPSFFLGRGYWDNWLMYEASRLEAQVVDTTSDVVALHQNHDYAHIEGVQKDERIDQAFFKITQGKQNLSLAGGYKNIYTNYDASYVLFSGKLKSTLSICFIYRRLKSILRRYKTILKGA